MKISAVVFDFGGVMTMSTRPMRVIELAKAKNIPWEIIENGFSAHRLRHDAGFISLREMYEAIWKDAGIVVDEATTRLFTEEDSASWLYRRERTRLWMKELKDRGFKIGILTNMNAELGESLFKVAYADYIALADATVISGEVRLHKPMPEIYNLMRGRIDAPAEEICFIDDVGKNTEGAKACGWRAIRFISNEQTEADFERLLLA
jgi:putative hydrolase of the HAD superfamily